MNSGRFSTKTLNSAALKLSLHTPNIQIYPNLSISSHPESKSNYRNPLVEHGQEDADL
jgi:hypothetical protein